MKTGGGRELEPEFIVSIIIFEDLEYGAIGRTPEDGFWKCPIEMYGILTPQPKQMKDMVPQCNTSVPSPRPKRV